MRIRCLVFFLLATLHSGAWVYAQTPDASVVSVSGRATVRGPKGAETKPLKKDDNLFAGQRVICADGCKELTISYCKVKVPVARGPKGRLIVSINCSGPEGVRAGGRKGEGVSVISPKESELVRPETFAVRWKPTRSPLRLAVGVYLGEKIWGPEEVNGSKGSFTSKSSGTLAAALNNAQKAGDLHLILIVDDETEQTQRVKFDLISESDQRMVNKKLKIFAGETDRVLKALGSGMVFSEHGLYGEAVEEFEKALTLSQAPDADKENLVELIKLTIRANYMAYDDERMRQLCASPQLPASDLPDVCLNSPQ